MSHILEVCAPHDYRGGASSSHKGRASPRRRDILIQPRKGERGPSTSWQGMSDLSQYRHGYLKFRPSPRKVWMIWGSRKVGPDPVRASSDIARASPRVSQNVFRST